MIAGSRPPAPSRHLATLLSALLPGVCLVWAVPATSAAADDPESIRQLVVELKSDPRGPFLGIRWFCPDGSVVSPRERCEQRGGLQHGLLKDSVSKLAADGLHLDPVLAGQDPQAFWADAALDSPLQQYTLQQYLAARDDGWIMHRGRFYRGALQAEDEDAWSRRFLLWLLDQDEIVRSHFYRVRQAARDLPRAGSASLADAIRAGARAAAEAYPDFMDLRVKIHGQPDARDAVRVETFRRSRRGQLTPVVDAQLAALAVDLRALFASATVEALADSVGSDASPLRARIERVQAAPSTAERCEALADLLLVVRHEILLAELSAERLRLVDLSLMTSRVLMAEVSRWQPRTPRGLLRQNYMLAKAATGSGALELWEWNAIEAGLRPPGAQTDLTARELLARAQRAQRAVAWGSSLVRAAYQPVIDRYAAFEPLARGFVDDRTRASVLLAQGAAAAELSAYAARRGGLENHVLDLKHPERLRGLNPGLVRGRLEVIDGPAEEIPFQADRIYVLLRPPAEMQAVAGILSVTAGNAVSHVQLLARNLGIPNAVLSAADLRELTRHAGEEVLYAVSPRGAVLMKPASEMTEEERGLVEEDTRIETRLTAPTEDLDMTARDIVEMPALGATDSGRICGPKAANLGVLSRLFPEAVPPGLVLPFGVFREHLEQPIPGRDGETYWDAVEAAFLSDSDDLASALAGLRDAIRQIHLLPRIEAQLRERFRTWIGAPLGEIPVFIRSDTNMEDLEGFTGAGLNLTVPNVRSEQDVLQAIRDVWASPFTDRALGWRRRVLTNPEQVYPSIVILPSVEVDRSGVMITSDVRSGSPADTTVAFNRGGTGAVGGQAAETWLLRADGRDELLSPAREPAFTQLAPGGGLERVSTSFEQPILSEPARAELRRIAARIREELPGTPGLSRGPYDVELGFEAGAPWLFQVRPFVEKRAGRSVSYLQQLDAAPIVTTPIVLDAPFG